MTINGVAAAGGATGPDGQLPPAGPGTAAGAWWRTRRGQLAVGVPVVAALAAVIGFLALAPGGSAGPATARGASVSAPAPVGSHASPVLRASVKPKAAAKPPPVGDACVVGSWHDNGGHSTTTWDGTTVQVTGGTGNVDHIAASGTDTDVYGPDTFPSYGTYNGSTLEEEVQGEQLITIHVNPRNRQLSAVYHGWTVSSTVKYVYQGSTSTGYLPKPSPTPAIFGYRCTASTLTWIYQGKVNDTETRLSDTP